MPYLLVVGDREAEEGPSRCARAPEGDLGSRRPPTSSSPSWEARSRSARDEEARSRRPRRAIDAAADAWAARTRARVDVPPAPVGTPERLTGLPHVVLGTGEVVHIAGTFRRPVRGLLGTDELPPHHALLLTSTRSVHTLGMRMPLDLVWFDAAGGLVGLDEAVRPGLQRRCKAASGCSSRLRKRAALCGIGPRGRCGMMTGH